ncbi:tRNA (adenosine(37)-N6)-threonylcarbamoyltransferase complex dimerization subunit type 1 TsaB [Methylopila turkensis]|uniref:tRNA (Adenosine(37)-N6)-threonylcarbamoyltransferase complex dimerization subunit type 1 TsaB n=1 Tax=Methylopila turkensis TaxID=1437816 RepID=A0A9W6N7S7_9HYPH|nr:tRNA (adenosine(37)-N6)-threonylcarbamoyltransferase complex dimerization subunit type 1 TsaB [Methylopila turkensis]GLK81549.1 tRNA (adenosine(37)-N6)-threonylcarbamoyltransferase complex dimerization subunit type 1 TsaB [Methylopila turkensis]
MRVLAIDTALGAASAAVVETGDGAAPALVFSKDMARGHAEALMPLVAQALESAGGLSAIDRIAVTVGPGSFTGLRVGLACARALALAGATPIVGVSTLEALAAPSFGRGAAVAAAIDARHGRVFAQGFDAAGAPLAAPALLPAEAFARALPENALVVGSGADAVIAAAGDRPLRKADGPHHAPNVIVVARRGAACDPDDAPPRPLYLKAADAHPQTGGRIARRLDES